MKNAALHKDLSQFVEVDDSAAKINDASPILAMAKTSWIEKTNQTVSNYLLNLE